MKKILLIALAGVVATSYAKVNNFNASHVNSSDVSMEQGVFPGTAYVGYWSNLSTNDSGTSANPTIQATVEAGYNVISVAFGVLNGEAVSLYSNGYNNNGYGVDVDATTFDNDINVAHSNGAKVLLSFGGGNAGLWNPDTANPDAVATSIVNFLKEHHFDGVDFDLEANLFADQNYLEELIGSMRQLATTADFPNGFFVTGAPQITTTSYPSSYDTLVVRWNGGASLDELMATNACKNYNCFDALFVQNYNNEAMEQQAGEKAGNSVAGAYQITSNQLYSDGNNGYTRIIIGHPAYLTDGKFTTQWPDFVSYAKQLQASSSASQFGGIMVWTASSDYTSTPSSPWSIIKSFN